MTTVQDLIAGSAGRGAWIGLFPDEKIEYDGGHVVEDAHVTLAHLGRGLSASSIELAHDACKMMALHGRVASARVDGIARLEQKAGSAIVMLLRDDVLALWADEARRQLDAMTVRYDRKFPFRAHLTLAKIKIDQTSAIARVEPRPLLFETLALVVGDNRITWRLAA